MCPTKVEYEQVFNQLLDVDIKWSYLRKEDLMQLALLFENPEIFMKKLNADLGMEAGRRRLVEAGLETVKELANNWQGPLAKLLKRVMAESKRSKHFK